jgi:hypothetical protein
MYTESYKFVRIFTDQGFFGVNLHAPFCKLDLFIAMQQYSFIYKTV